MLRLLLSIEIRIFVFNQNEKTMIETLNYEEVPFHFTHCIQADCPKASSCLRYQATRFLPTHKRDIKVLNPAFIGNPVECKEYLSDEPVLYAFGISKLYDELPYAKAKDIKDDVIFRIGKTQYYRMKKEIIGISPLQQRTIKEVFLKYGIVADPVFDRYEAGYQW